MATSLSPPPGWFRRTLTRLLLDGRGPAWLLSVIHRHMRHDDAWHAHYHGLRSIEQASMHRDFGPGQIDLVERLIMSELPAMKPQRSFVGLLAVAGATAAIMVLVDMNTEEGAGWTARSGTADQAVGARVRCIDGTEQAIVAEAEVAPGIARGGLRCPRGALLSFSVTNRSDAERFIFIVGLSPAGDLRWYAPFVEASRSASMPAGAVDELLPVVADTSTMPGDGRVTLHALFSERALSGAEVAQLVRGAASRGIATGALERLPMQAAVQQGRLELLEVSTK